MVISKNSLRGVELDVAGLAAVIGLAVAGYLLLLRGPAQDVLAAKPLEQEQAVAARDLVSLQAEYSRRFRELETSRGKLASQGGWLADTNLPADVLSRVNELARQCNVRITRWQPQGVQNCQEYQEQLFSMDGVATWPGLLQWMALTEQGVPLLDVSHFSLSTPANPGQGEFEFSCSLKLYRGAASPGVQTVAVKP